jgi:peptidoglycan hydrolase CwlO-like protein
MTQTTNGWVFKKEIQLGHLLTTLMVVVSVIIYIQKIETRLAVAESEVKQLQQDHRDLEGALNQINSKLDRLIERGAK